MEKFKNDLRREELIPVKILMFLIYGGQATLYPYFTVHLKSLGVSIKQTAIIFAIQPVVALIVAPMIGRSFGSLLGGFLVQTYGFRETFRFFAYGAAGFGLFYSLMYLTWLRRWHISHRKTSSINDDKKRDSLTEEEEEETMKNQAFTSFSLHCSTDGPGIISFMPEPESLHFRPRALSHEPIQIDNSFNKYHIPPRYTQSFSAANRSHKFSQSINSNEYDKENNEYNAKVTQL